MGRSRSEKVLLNGRDALRDLADKKVVLAYASEEVHVLPAETRLAELEKLVGDRRIAHGGLKDGEPKKSRHLDALRHAALSSTADTGH